MPHSPYSLTRPLTHPLTHSLTHSLQVLDVLGREAAGLTIRAVEVPHGPRRWRQRQRAPGHAGAVRSGAVPNLGLCSRLVGIINSR